jgi:hypothetical protein
LITDIHSHKTFSAFNQSNSANPTLSICALLFNLVNAVDVL